MLVSAEILQQIFENLDSETDDGKNKIADFLLYCGQRHVDKSEDFKKAIKCFRLAYKQGSSGAAYELSKIYQEGKGTLKRTKVATMWLQMAIKLAKGYTVVSAEDKLIITNKNASIQDHNVKTNDEKINPIIPKQIPAPELKKKSLEINKSINKQAQEQTGIKDLNKSSSNERKQGKPKYSQTAIKIIQLFDKANNGDTKSQYLLGKMFLKGDKLVKNVEEAFRWLNKAAESGHGESKSQLTLLKKQIKMSSFKKQV